MPRLSVVMPVHNALPYLDEAIRSITEQTFSDFEFVILNDGSNDGSDAVLRRWAERDARIRLIESDERLGPAGSSNRVVQESGTPLIARMDADDVSHPQRLERQIAIMDQVPDAVLSGCPHDTVDAKGQLVRKADLSRLLRRSPFAPFGHGSIMWRREAFDAIGGYRSACNYWEDIDFVTRIARQGRILVVPESLYSHRIAVTSTRLTSRRGDITQAYGRMYQCLERYIRGESYEDLLDAPAPDRVAPGTFTLLGSPVVWAGGSPKLLRPLLTGGHLAADLNSAAVLAWTAWADISPRSLRMFLRGYLAIRNRSARRKTAGKAWIEWTPPRL
ncbi:MAG TPA: glycosyltransferase family A protein [Allosphingosinicella sp.]|jgi:glycosyltransferase involved in cell wall biosynthesis